MAAIFAVTTDAAARNVSVGGLIVALLLTTIAYAGGFDYVVAISKRRAEDQAILTHQDLVTDLAALVDPAAELLSRGANRVHSFLWAGSHILNKIHRIQEEIPPQALGDAREYRRIEEIFQLWQNTENYWEPVLREISRKCETEAKQHTGAYGNALELMSNYLGAAFTSVNRFIDAVRAAKSLALTDVERDSWMEFQNRANALLDRLDTLLQKTQIALKVQTYAPSEKVRTLW